MALNYGKKFEQKLKEDMQKVEGVSIDRLADVTSGYYGIRNVSDFIIYKFPFICYCECKSHTGNTFPIKNLTQYDKLITKKGIKGVKAGVILWFIDHKQVVYIPIEGFEKMKAEGLKSVNIKMNYEDYGIIEIPSKIKRVFLDSDYTYLFNKWEAELV